MRRYNVYKALVFTDKGITTWRIAARNQSSAVKLANRRIMRNRIRETASMEVVNAGYTVSLD